MLRRSVESSSTERAVIAHGGSDRRHRSPPPPPAAAPTNAATATVQRDRAAAASTATNRGGGDDNDGGGRGSTATATSATDGFGVHRRSDGRQPDADRLPDAAVQLRFRVPKLPTVRRTPAASVRVGHPVGNATAATGAAASGAAHARPHVAVHTELGRTATVVVIVTGCGGRPNRARVADRADFVAQQPGAEPHACQPTVGTVYAVHAHVYAATAAKQQQSTNGGH